MKQDFLVLGLGRFGSSVLKELSSLGHHVVGVDKSQKTLQDPELEEAASYLVEGDATNSSFLKELNATDFDAITVSMGDDFESAILIVLALRELGCKTIYAKANDKKRGKGLEGAGATKVIYPEEETGRRVAHHIANPHILQYIQFAPHCSGMEMDVPEEFIGKTLAKLDFRRKYNALVVMINNKNQEYPTISPNPEYIFAPGDMIFVVGDDKDLEKLRRIIE